MGSQCYGKCSIVIEIAHHRAHLFHKRANRGSHSIYAINLTLCGRVVPPRRLKNVKLSMATLMHLASAELSRGRANVPAEPQPIPALLELIHVEWEY